MKILIIATALLLGSSFQEARFTLVRSIPVHTGNFTTDDLGNVYLAQGSTLAKYSPDGDPGKTYSNKNLGNISGVDVTNPLRILVFYESFRQVILLNNQLASPSDPVSLESLGYNQASLVCSSHDNGLWIYNSQNFELVRLDQNFKQTNKTENIHRLAMSGTRPCFLIERNNNVFLNDSAAGILVFDIYGTYTKTIPLKGLNDFQVSNHELIYFRSGKLKSYNMKTLSESEINLPTTGVLNARSEKEKLYLLKQNSLDIYYVKNQK